MLTRLARPRGRWRWPLAPARSSPQKWTRTVYSSTSAPADPYEVLGVPRGASPEEVRKAYLERAKKLHPDANPAEDAQRAFQQLQAAYASLANGTGHGDAFTSSGSTSATASTSSASPPRGAAGWDPMGSGMHYDEFKRFHAERAEREARDDPTPASPWDLLRSRRGWVYGGLVHRSLHSLGRNLWALLPFVLIVSLLGTLVRGQRGGPPVQGVELDNFGRAWMTDRNGKKRRMPQLDNFAGRP
eukprot:TRINITY_DN7137_c3_g1_i1.p1 TRINITY_DN7137_c3_g1~~TRINITY_DN7137_c3_g1_i1.p1  ORF type:complete len:283 (+),score=25.73 TRINITY_DN7137_c3_g1_i1:118-849(+)